MTSVQRVVVDRLVGLWWPLQRVVQRYRWARLRFVTSWQARAHGSRVTLSVAPDARIGRRASFEALPDTRSRVDIGAGATIGDDFTVQLSGGTLTIGAGALLRSGIRVTCGGRLDLAERVYISYGVLIHCAEHVTLAPDAFIGEYSCITDSVHLRTPLEIPAFHTLRTGKTRVGANVWLGAHAVVSMGVDVGDGAFVGANAVVTKDVPPFALAAGVPAKVLRQLEIELP